MVKWKGRCYRAGGAGGAAASGSFVDEECAVTLHQF